MKQSGQHLRGATNALVRPTLTLLAITWNGMILAALGTVAGSAADIVRAVAEELAMFS